MQKDDDKKIVDKDNFSPLVIYAYIDSADMDVDGLGHVVIRKHKKVTMERTISELRKYIGKSVAIFVSDGGK